jgi:hypothetical protein
MKGRYTEGRLDNRMADLNLLINRLLKLLTK